MDDLFFYFKKISLSPFLDSFFPHFLLTTKFSLDRMSLRNAHTASLVLMLEWLQSCLCYGEGRDCFGVVGVGHPLCISTLGVHGVIFWALGFGGTLQVLLLLQLLHLHV